jgi:hypothetical protein
MYRSVETGGVAPWLGERTCGARILHRTHWPLLTIDESGGVLAHLVRKGSLLACCCYWALLRAQAVLGAGRMWFVVGRRPPPALLACARCAAGASAEPRARGGGALRFAVRQLLF